MSDAIIATIDALRSRASTQETLLTLAVPVEHSAFISQFLGMIGQQVGVAFADLRKKRGVEEKRDPINSEKIDSSEHMPDAEDNGHYIAALYKSGFWFNPKVLAALGSDAEYVAWIQRQPSCISGEFSEYVNGEGRCVAAHVRRAGKSGTAFKESYATVPLTQAEHNDQHQSGESEFGGKEFFDKKLAEYKAEWAHIQLRKALNVEHLRSASIEQIREWAIKADVYSALPLVFKS